MPSKINNEEYFQDISNHWSKLNIDLNLNDLGL